MSFTSNDTLKKLEKLLPESIHNQSVPKDILGIIDEYIPTLNDTNIHQVVKDYLSNDPNKVKQTINNYGSISNWDVSHVTDMSNLFYKLPSINGNIIIRNEFNEYISNWNVSNVVYMNNMFYTAESFNQSLNNWNVSNV